MISQQENSMELPIKVKHILDSDFHDPFNCSTAKAAKEFFDVIKVVEALIFIVISDPLIGDVVWHHDFYGIHEFNEDYDKALKELNNETIIRTIKLKL